MPERSDGRDVCGALWPIDPSADLFSMGHLHLEDLSSTLHRCTKSWNHEDAHGCRCGSTAAHDPPEGSIVFCSRYDGPKGNRAVGSTIEDCATCGHPVWVAPSSHALEKPEFHCIEHAPGMGVPAVTLQPGLREELVANGVSDEQIDAMIALGVHIVMGQADDE